VVPGRPSDDCATSPKLFGPSCDLILRGGRESCPIVMRTTDLSFGGYLLPSPWGWRCGVCWGPGAAAWSYAFGDDATRCLPNPETFGSQVGVVIRDELRYGFLAPVLHFMQSERKKSPRGKSSAADSNKRVWKVSALAAAKSKSISGILTYGHSELAFALGAASMVANNLLLGFKHVSGQNAIKTQESTIMDAKGESGSARHRRHRRKPLQRFQQH